MSGNADGLEPDVIRLASVDSTNSEGLRRAVQTGLRQAWIVAEQQLGGRGRHGRLWSSEPGGLYSTRVIVTPLPLDVLVGLTLVAGLAVRDAVATHMPPEKRDNLVIKWPNDILVANEKLAGILIETEALGNGEIAVAIGMGVNVSNFLAAEEGAGGTSIAHLGGTSDCGDVFETLRATFAGWMAVWNEGAGFEAVREAWESRGMSRGTPARVRLPSGTVEGRFAGLDKSGALRLRLVTGAERLIHAGEIIVAHDRIEKGAQT